MHTAVRLNVKIRERSSDAKLIIVNLPEPPHERTALHNYMEFMDVRNIFLSNEMFFFQEILNVTGTD